MWIVRILALAAIPVLAAAPLLQAPAAHAQASCDWYARKALEQQRANIERQCGFKGPSWTSDYKEHLTWCKSTSPDDWKRQAQMRDQQLAKCPGR